MEEITTVASYPWNLSTVVFYVWPGRSYMDFTHPGRSSRARSWPADCTASIRTPTWSMCAADGWTSQQPRRRTDSALTETALRSQLDSSNGSSQFARTL